MPSACPYRARFSRLVAVACSAAALAACGGIPPDEEAGRIFDTTTSVVVEFHLAVVDRGRFPETAIWPCDAGQIVLDTDESSGLPTLGHRFEDCELDGRVYNGDLPYRDVRQCSFGGWELVIEGELEIEGAANFERCSFDAAEACNGTFSGSVCGIDLADTDSELAG